MAFRGRAGGERQVSAGGKSMTDTNECLQARKKLGMTQAKFAELLEVNQSTIARLETGKRRMTPQWRLAFQAVVNGAEEGK